MFSAQFLGGRHQKIFTVSWTRRRTLLNWLTFRLRGASRLRDATVRSRAAIRGNISPWCVPRRPSAAIFSLHASPKGPRTGKAPLPGNISPPCIQNELAMARYARHVSEKPCKSPFGNAPREDLATKGAFSLHGPLKSRTTRESCHPAQRQTDRAPASHSTEAQLGANGTAAPHCTTRPQHPQRCGPNQARCGP